MVLPRSKPRSKPRPKPLHKNVVFLTLMALIVAFMMMSVILYARIKEEPDDDDLVPKNGIEHHHKHHHHRHHHHNPKEPPPKDTSSSSSLSEQYLGVPPEQAIAKFQKDQDDAKEARRKQGILTPRETFEQERFDPEDWERILKSVQAQRIPEIPNIPNKTLQEEEEEEEEGDEEAAREPILVPYDIHDCPLEPPPNYPVAWNVMQVLDNWNPDDTELLPKYIYQGVCVFDWNNPTHSQKAENYRRHELPFVLQNYPETMRAAERWMTPGYLQELAGKDETFPTEHSRNNHFLFWSNTAAVTKKTPQDYVPPTDMVDMTLAQWHEKADELEHKRRQTRQEHWYLRLNAMLHNHAYLYEELPFFDPTFGKSITMVIPEEHQGINCRFGMKGTIAEAHYDSYNNFIAILGGRRRFILAHPDQCENLELYPMGHPSARHSRINWSNAYSKWHDSERLFAQTRVNELILQTGDILFLPTFWFHFIVSLTTTYQCNSRSGSSKEYEHHISKCGFGPRTEYQRKEV
ncbi:Hypoxia-inducible factor 1-alpha inhibitor [Seminavis robusta]|uniref:Hypoxia-inducible factor 1-alpha inhibitor n=1 Tax=Seminavis robusta TaxID=568900 RepID=A0A9N8DPV5_9STRA|nr:Hypoxia-inducible factor 1-alpha inhibitor [Seminavis robusta]|eukprot:Sro200_g084800.1 Hypoxia-inducible factor 1-alpha inhibitor (520) ;mRNA; r:59137-61058